MKYFIKVPVAVEVTFFREFEVEADNKQEALEQLEKYETATWAKIECDSNYAGRAAASVVAFQLLDAAVDTYSLSE